MRTKAKLSVIKRTVNTVRFVLWGKNRAKSGSGGSKPPYGNALFIIGASASAAPYGVGVLALC